MSNVEMRDLLASLLALAKDPDPAVSLPAIRLLLEYAGREGA